MKKFIVITFIIMSSILFAQNDTISIDYNISCFVNNLWNSGLKFGTEYILKQQINKKQQNDRKKKKKVKIQELILNADGGFYWDPMSHIAFFLFSGIKYRNTATEKFQWNIGLNPIGYYRSFLPETYEVNDNGEIKKIFLPGKSYYSPSLTIGIGKYRKDKKMKAWFLNFNFMLLYKYNADLLPLINTVYGYRFDWK